MKKKMKIATIKGTQLMAGTRGKLSRNDGQVKSGTGYHRSARDYNRRGKEGQRLKNRLKDYGSGPLFYGLLPSV